MATTHTIGGLIVLIISCFYIADVRGIEYKETAENQLGHKRYTNGDIKWGNIPDRDYHGNIKQKGSGVWKTTINFAKSIVLVTTHHQSFPYDLIRRIIRNEYSEDEITDYEENIVISCGVGAIFIGLILICCVAYFLYKRWKNRRSAYSGQKPFLTGQKLNAVIVLGIIFILIIFIFTICILVVNARIGDGINRLDRRLYNSMDDVTSYFNQTKQQYDFMTEDSNLWFGQDVLTQDINTLGELIWQPGSRSFYPNVSAIFKELENLDSYTSKAIVSLKSLIDEMLMINNGIGRHLKSNLSTANYNLSFARSDWTCIGCDGSCSGCEDIVPNDIYPQVNFLTMPNLTSNLMELQELLREPFKGSLLSPEYYYTYGIGDILQNKLSTNISDIQSRMNDFINTVRRSTDAMVFPTEKSFYFDELKPKFSAFKDRVKKGDNIRSGFTWFFTVVNIGLIIFILSVLIYVITKKYKHCRTLIVQQEDPYLLQRRLLLGGAVGCIILSVGHTCLASTGFYIGANLERVICQTGKDYSIVERVLDIPHTVPGHPGYYMGSVVLGNGAYDLKLSEILRQCKNDIPAYTALRQNLVSPKLKDDLNIAKYLNNINEVFDDMYIDLNNVTLIPPPLPSWIQKLIDVTSFDTQPFTDLFNKTIIKADLDTFVANLRYVANTTIANGGPRNPAKSKLIEVADYLWSWKPMIDSATLVKDKMEILYNDFQENIMEVKTRINQSISNLLGVEDQLWNESSRYIKQGVDEYRSDFMKVLPKFSDKSLKWVNGEIGSCQPLSDAYNSVVYGFCHQFADFENAEWLLNGLTSVFLLVLTIIIMITYNSLILDTTQHDHLTSDFEKIFGNGKTGDDGLVNKTMYRVKNTMSRLSVSVDTGRRRSSVSPLDTPQLNGERKSSVPPMDTMQISDRRRSSASPNDTVEIPGQRRSSLSPMDAIREQRRSISPLARTTDDAGGRRSSVDTSQMSGERRSSLKPDGASPITEQRRSSLSPAEILQIGRHRRSSISPMDTAQIPEARESLVSPKETILNTQQPSSPSPSTKDIDEIKPSLSPMDVIQMEEQRKSSLEQLKAKRRSSLTQNGTRITEQKRSPFDKRQNFEQRRASATPLDKLPIPGQPKEPIKPLETPRRVSLAVMNTAKNKKQKHAWNASLDH